MKKLFFIFALAIFLVSTVQFAFSQSLATLNIQGVLREPSGKAVADGNYSLTFKIYNVETGGTALWTETQSSVEVVNGVFNVILGSVTALNLPFNQVYYVGITYGGSEMLPRIRLTSAPYALALAGQDNKFPSSGTVGIGTSSPDANYKLHINGKVLVDNNNLYVNNAESGSGLLRVGSAWGYPGIYGENGSKPLILSSSTGKVYVNAKLGIGTDNPAEKLHIASGNLRIDGGEIQSVGPIVFRPDVDNTGDKVINFTGTNEFQINGSKPIVVRRFNNIGTGWTSYNTGYPVSDWVAGIIGFYAYDGDIYEIYTSSNIIVCRMKDQGGYWHIVCDLASHVNHEEWHADVIFISRKMADIPDGWGF